MRLLGGLLVVVAIAASACGDDGSASCVEIREPLDPLSIQHVLDGDSVIYPNDQPTSGPHLSGPSVSGLLTEPIIPAAQVRVLEEGGVVVQFGATVDVGDLTPMLDASAVPMVIAPADTLPAAVVATAWTWKLTCERPDAARILDFTGRASFAPGSD